ncbi:hypothetical protein KEF85_08875 [Methylomonas paludis]|uniref:Uncharacterized protein n=1 Tax=Methylomonas paludis TaxID=1173101 RepID=A0A975ML13_9GAMM|nr:hypothetical protein [Methylomonas paludis]QWF69495.1 hypothetical protein KEF85_08875 [Methylomonas paludis]
MNIAEICQLIIKPSRTTVAVVFMLVFHAAGAKSAPPKPAPVNQVEVQAPALQAAPLILSLPDTEIKTTDSILDMHSQQAGDNLQLLAGNRKKAPVNLDCGMDLYQNSAPDVSLGSRLTGVCDLKYHY